MNLTQEQITEALKVAQATAKVMREMAERKNETILKLEAQLAERDAQLAVERERLHDLLERSYGILENVAIADSGDAEQDAFERETFNEVKKELGK